MIYWFDILALHLRDLFSNPVQSKVTKDPSSLRAWGGYRCQKFMGACLQHMGWRQWEWHVDAGRVNPNQLMHRKSAASFKNNEVKPNKW